MRIELEFGSERLAWDVPASRLIEFRPDEPARPIDDVSEAIRKALAAPDGLPSLSSALTPDDHVTLVVDARIPRLTDMLPAALESVLSALGPSGAITVLTAPGIDGPVWRGDMSAGFKSVSFCEHDPDDRRSLAYLATTKGGRRIYLNRHLVDADQVVMLSVIRADPLLGYSGGAGGIFPTFTDRETMHELYPQLSMRPPENGNWPVRTEAEEVAWLLGLPVMVQVVEGPGDSVAAIRCGLPGSSAAGYRSFAQTWQSRVDRPAAVVVAGVSGDRVTTADLAAALACAARVVQPDGHVVLLTKSAPPLGEGFELIRRSDDARKALHHLRKLQPRDYPAAFSWLQVVQRARVFLHSGWDDDTAEELFTTALADPRQVQRLIDAGGDCVFIPDAHRAIATLGESNGQL